MESKSDSAIANMIHCKQGHGDQQVMLHVQESNLIGLARATPVFGQAEAPSMAGAIGEIHR